VDFDFPEFISDAFFNDAKYKVIVAGRRTGKTFNGVQWICANLLAKPGKSGLHVDTTQENLLKYQKRYYQPILKDYWPYKNWTAQRYKPTVELYNGSFIDFASAEKPQNMEGFEYDYIILNEAGIILKKPELWTNSIMPMAKKAKVVFIGTPKGRNLFHQLYTQGLSEDGEYSSYRFSAMDSPYWTEEELENIKDKTPQEVWKQEYLAEFLEGGGQVFRDIGKCIQSKEVKQAESGKQYVMAIDLAKHQDFTVILVAEKDTKQVVYMDRFNQIDWQFQKKRIFGAWQKFNRPKAIIDSTGVGDSIYDDLVAHGMFVESFKFTSTSKNEIIQNLSVSIDNREITYHPFPELINELEIFGYEVTRMGNIRYNAPEGFHDDTVVTLAMLNKLMNSGYDFTFLSNY